VPVSPGCLLLHQHRVADGASGQVAGPHGTIRRLGLLGGGTRKGAKITSWAMLDEGGAR
jgi:hypothetical protein